MVESPQVMNDQMLFLETLRQASKMSKQELNNKINECMDAGKFIEASKFAQIWIRRYGSNAED